MSNINLIKLHKFFEVDIKLKKEMYNAVPPITKEYLEKDIICKYTNNLEDSLIYIFRELKLVALDIFGENSLVLKRIEELEIVIKNNFYSCGLDMNKLRKFYEKYISNMEINFIDAVKENCVGYKLCNSIPLNMANSLNEILHLIHSYIINNENILQSIPIIAQKQNIFNYPITLRGTNTSTFNQLFNEFPIDLDVGHTDMVSISDKKLIMMVRDRGHALTMEITINNNIARIEYFIPKLCNIDMIKKLPGINKVNENSVGATGTIEVDINKLSKTLFDFISKVPTDADIVYTNKIKL